MSGLEPLGLAGPSALKELLTTCTDPIEAITNFQSENSVKCPSLAPALKLLDLHNVRRLEFHDIVLNDLRERLLAKIREISQPNQQHTLAFAKASAKKLNDLMVKSFPLVNVPQLRPIILETLKFMSKIPGDYLKQITDDKALYADVAVEVKQQIWEQNEELYLKEIGPVVDEYINCKQKFFLDLESYAPGYFMESSKARRHNKLVQHLLNMVGRNVTLYDRFLQYIREMFLDTKNVHLCSLRSELLMALHDADVQDLINLDPCHKFAWCLDACLREKHLDPKHAAELKGVLDGIKRGKEQILGDLAMIAGDPHTLHFLCQLISKVLSQCVVNESLPRDHSALQLVLRLLSIGLKAWHMLSTSEYREPKIDSIIYTKFLSSLMMLMCQDQARLLSDKIALSTSFDDDEPSCLEEVVELNGSPDKPAIISDPVIVFLKSDALCCSLMLYYALDVAKKRDITGLMRILPLMSRSNGELAYQERYLHVMLWHLISQCSDALGSNDEFFDAIFNQFFFKKQNDFTIIAQAVKLAYFSANRLTKTKRDYLLERFLGVSSSGETSDDDIPDFFASMLSHVTKKFADVDAEKDNENVSAPAPAPVGLQRSLSIDFPDVPTPMMVNM